MTTPTLPRASTRSAAGAAPLRSDGARLLQVVLLVAGAVLLPVGLVVIVLGWYGAAHSPYEYDQLSYLVSGGLLGLGLTFCGGFLYFGSWLARIAADQKESATRLADTLLVLADVVSKSSARSREPGSARDPGPVLVVAGSGTTVHRADCSLVEGRGDIAGVGRRTAGLTPCRLCAPETAGV